MLDAKTMAEAAYIAFVLTAFRLAAMLVSTLAVWLRSRVAMRFRLGTMLVAMTLFAVVLELVCYTVR